MDLNIRRQLEELAEHLRLHSGPGEEQAQSIYQDVQTTLDNDDHQGLPDRLARYTVELENEHPELASILRRVADALGAGGI